jgi:GTP-binding protein HflX
VKNIMIENREDAERVLLVIVSFKKGKAHWSVDEDLNEMRELIVACGGEVVEKVICSVDKPTAGYLISESKAKDIADLCSVHNVDTVIFSHDLQAAVEQKAAC